jgi:hypothetical protein
MEGLVRIIGAHPWITLLAALLFFLAAAFILKKIKMLAIIFVAVGITAFYLLFRSGAFTGMGPDRMNTFRDKTKDKVMESIKKEFRR